jgi:hypothetical protein
MAMVGPPTYPAPRQQIEMDGVDIGRRRMKVET